MGHLKVRPVSVSIAYDGRHGARPVAHVVLVDSAGGVHERTGDMEPGKWATWTPDQLPDRKQQKRSKRRRR